MTPMASQTISFVVLPRGNPIKGLTEVIELSRTASTAELHEKLSVQSGISIHRLRITKGSDGKFVPNNKDVAIRQTGLLDGSRIYVKDLGTSLPLLSYSRLIQPRATG